MLGKFFKAAAVAAVLVSTSLARPLYSSSQPARRTVSFDNFNGLSAFSDFDSFFGADNFAGLLNAQVLAQQQELVCATIDANIAQQNLLILQQVAQQVILQQACEVELQAALFEQFFTGLNVFGSDLLRNNGRTPGFDIGIASQFDSLFVNGELNNVDLGFSGLDLGQQFLIPSGSNWVDGGSSFSSVSSVFSASEQAISFSKSSLVFSSQ